jgi:hypothetical protein
MSACVGRAAVTRDECNSCSALEFLALSACALSDACAAAIGSMLARNATLVEVLCVRMSCDAIKRARSCV